MPLVSRIAHRHVLPYLLVALSLLAGGCASDPEPTPEAAPEPAPRTATARIDPLGESTIAGTVTFTEADGGVLVSYDLSGLEVGEHGFHVHENGECGVGEDGALGGAAGGHFNPTNAPHGPRDAAPDSRHVGDLGNVTSTAGGTTGGVARGEFVDPLISLSGPNSIVGRAMMVHFGQDDLTSQPSGDAGDRIGCGPIRMTSPAG